MKQLRGRVAVVTGAGSGIGRSIAQALGREGMRVVCADVELECAAETATLVRGAGGEARAEHVDVASAASVRGLAERALAAFGAVHLLCNNAGVNHLRPLQAMTDDDWHWLLSVNLEGVIHGVQAFLPAMLKAQGERHIVNTASIAGLSVVPDLGIGAYTTTKFAIVGFSESLRHDLAREGIGVSVLCPGAVHTRIRSAERNRPVALGGSGAPARPARTDEPIPDHRMDPALVGPMLVEGVKQDELYIFTHAGPETRRGIDARHEAIRAALERWAARHARQGSAS